LDNRSLVMSEKFNPETIGYELDVYDVVNQGIDDVIEGRAEEFNLSEINGYQGAHFFVDSERLPWAIYQATGVRKVYEGEETNQYSVDYDSGVKHFNSLSVKQGIHRSELYAIVHLTEIDDEGSVSRKTAFPIMSGQKVSAEALQARVEKPKDDIIGTLEVYMGFLRREARQEPAEDNLPPSISFEPAQRHFRVTSEEPVATHVITHNEPPKVLEERSGPFFASGVEITLFADDQRYGDVYRAIFYREQGKPGDDDYEMRYQIVDFTEHDDLREFVGQSSGNLDPDNAEDQWRIAHNQPIPNHVVPDSELPAEPGSRATNRGW
jgi:hypothetical protein